MKLRNIALYASMFVLATSFVACDDWLAKEPSKSTNKTLSNTEELDALVSTISCEIIGRYCR